MLLFRKLSSILSVITSREKRIASRIPAHLFARYPHSDSIRAGLVKNLSEDGLYFISGADLPRGSRIELSILFNEDIIKVPVIIRRTEKTRYLYAKKTGSLHKGFGAEILNQSQGYRKIFSDTFETLCSS